MDEPILCGKWDTLEDIQDDWPRAFEALKGATLHFASYIDEDYYGEALIVFSRDGQLFEFNGSHCSCYGLDEQGFDVEPAEAPKAESTSWGALARRHLQHSYKLKCAPEDTLLHGLAAKYLNAGG